MTTLHPIMQAALATFTRHLAPVEPKQIAEADWIAADLASRLQKAALGDGAHCGLLQEAADAITEAELIAADIANNKDKPAQHAEHALKLQIKDGRGFWL